MRHAFSVSPLKSAFPFKACIVVILALAAVMADVAVTAAAPSSAIVVDAMTGKTLYSKDANGRRYPASLTKMMTLYLTFEALAKGRITKATPVVFSRHAAAMPPTKLGLRPGGAVTVDTAILSMVTKSANDSATALGELLGGSEDNFARMMTAKARQLGMNGTVFRNANGLPNPGQFTTARDMATLGIALREHFPQYYGYFSQQSFMYGTRRINGHNRLLGRIKGVDGIKTGYTNASGFNLVSSVAIGDRRLVAVVMGGRTGRARDNQMAGLIQTYMPETSSRGRGDLIARNDDSNTPVAALAKVILPRHDAPTPDSKPRGSVEVASVDDSVTADAATPVRTAKAKIGKNRESDTSVAAYAEPIDPVATSSVGPRGWVVQVASSPSQTEAKAKLADVAADARGILARADGFTMPFNNKGTTYFRVRFGAFTSKTAAWKACTALKRKHIPCYAIEQ